MERETRLSTKGQVVLPGPVRKELGLRPGDSFKIRVTEGSVVLTPKRSRRVKGKIITDPITGLPVLTAGPGAPELTSEQVREILADFP
jgi:AbrB family looped-hinge helix DNA binding protein